MSGGVDSSVVAALLKSAGYDVVGITLQLYDHGEAVAQKGACCAGQDIHDARRVAEVLDIPHFVLNYEERFKTSVMEGFADSYIAGETPIPCVDCNQKIKFRDLLSTARELGAEALITGHYVVNKPGAKGWELYRAVDDTRDQSYFLFGTTREQLEVLRFPLGNLQKSETRALAEKFGLGVAQKSDSQDICFVPTGRYTQVIERLRPGACESGDIVHVNGHVLGQHDGIIHYTIGQRRGIGVAASEPLYVIHLDAEKREVVVGPRESLDAHWLRLRDVNWLGDEDFDALPETGLELCVKIRSTQAPQPATLYNRDEQAVIFLHDGETGVSPGQACVFYDQNPENSRVLGGGWIVAVDGAKQSAGERSSSGEFVPSAAGKIELTVSPKNLR